MFGVTTWPRQMEVPFTMQVVFGTVIGGKVVIEGTSLPEGTVVAVFAREEASTVNLSTADEAELLEALDDADRDEGMSAEQFFVRLQRYS